MLFIFKIVHLTVPRHFNKYVRTLECQLSHLLQPTRTAWWIYGVSSAKCRPLQSASRGEFRPLFAPCSTATVYKALYYSFQSGHEGKSTVWAPDADHNQVCFTGFRPAWSARCIV